MPLLLSWFTLILIGVGGSRKEHDLIYELGRSLEALNSSLSGMHGPVVLSDRMRAILEEALPEAARYISSPSEGRMREKVQVLDLATNKPDYSLLVDLPPPLRNARPVDAGVGVLHARLLQLDADKDLPDSVLVTVNSDNTLKIVDHHSGRVLSSTTVEVNASKVD
ncbi:hypothetical protein FOZ63_014519, partial [Perkinsus olseni]